MINDDLTQLKKYLINLKNFNFIGKPDKKGFNDINYIQDKETGKKYVSKTSSIISDTQNQQIILSEINFLIQIQNPTLISFQGFSFQDLQGDNNLTILIEYTENGSLFDLIGKWISPSEYDTKRQIMLVGISYGMMILHKHNIIHCNLNPKSVFIDENYHPKITDFFLSNFFKSNLSVNSNSIAYMAPESIITRKFDKKSDVFSFGILMYEIVAGSRAYNELFQSMNFSIFSFEKKIIEGIRPKFNVPVKKGLENLIEKCWSADPKQRPSFKEIFKKLSLNKTVKFDDSNSSEELLKDVDACNNEYCLDNVNNEELSLYVNEITSSNLNEELKAKKKEKVLQIEELCQNIFSFDKSNILIPQNLSENSKSFVSLLSRSFPIDSEIRSFLKDLKNGSFNDSIKNPIVSIDDCNQHLETILKEKDLFQFHGILETFSLYSFYCWISIQFIFNQGQKFNILTLLHILNYIIQITDNDAEKVRYHNVSISCFFNLTKSAIENDSVDDYETIFKEISDLFIKNNNLLDHLDELIRILSNKIINSDNKELNENSISFISLVTFILDQNPKVLSQQIILSIIKSTKAFIFNLNSIYLNFFLYSANYIEMDDFANIFKSLFIQILTNAASIHNIDDDKVNQLYEIDFSKKPITVNNRFDDNDNYFNPPADLYQIDKVDNSKIVDDFDVKNLITFINPQVFEIISFVKRIVLLNEKYAQYFLKEASFDLHSLDSIFNLQEKRENNNKLLLLKRIFYEQYSIVFYLVSSVIKKFPNIIFQNINGSSCPLFNNKYIFDPKVTYLSPNSNFDIINSLRQFTFEFLIDYYPMFLNEVLIDNFIYPEIFLESVCRIISIRKKENHILNDFKFSFISDTLIKSLINYRIDKDENSTDCKNENIDNGNIILINRKAILLYFTEYLKDDSMLPVTFTSSVFMNCFIALLIEPPIRQQFIHFLSKYLLSIELKDNNDSILPNLNQDIVKLFQISCLELPQSESSSLLLDVLNLLNELIIANKSLTHLFTPIASEICRNIKSFKFVSEGSEKVDEFFLALIDLLASTFFDKTIRVNDISLLESTLVYFTQNKSQIQIMDKLIEIIAGEKLTSISPNFEIQQYNILCSFIRIFINTNLIYKSVKFISDLCSYSSLNCIKCHEGELDFLIIKVLNDWRKRIIKVTETLPTDENNDLIINESKDQLYISQKLLNLLLFLLTQITSTASSIPVVQSFFSLLCPIQSSFLSPIHENTIKALNNILMESKTIPFSALAMDNKMNEIHIKNIQSSSFEKGLSFSFWISIPSNLNDYSQSILVLNDEDNHSFEIKMIDKSLRVIIQSGTIIYSSDFQLNNVPIKKWVMLTITTNISKQGTNITLYINKELIKNLLTFALFSPKESIECIVNHSNHIPKSDIFEPPLMGVFFLLKQLNKEEIESLNDEGQRSSFASFSEKIIFAYKTQNSTLLPIQKLKGIIESHQKFSQFQAETSFADLLILYDKTDLILPIFGQFDIPLKNGNKLVFNHLSIEILSNLFKLGEPAQISFFKINGFFAISHLIQNSEKTNISYELYKRFYNLLKIITYKNLQFQLIDAILMNINIWSICDLKGQILINKDWSQNLYNSYKDMIDIIRPLNWFLLIIHRFYDSENIFFQCRKSLFDISNESSKTNFLSTDLPLILELICSSNITLIERKEMLTFLTKIIHNKRIIVESKINISQVISTLFKIFNLPDKDDDIILQIISLFIIIYRHKDYNLKIQLHFLIQEIIISLHINQNYVFKIDIFSVLISLMNVNKLVELLPLLSINSILGGPNYLVLLLKNMDRKLNYFVSKQSIIYPALLLFTFFSNTYLYHEVIRMNTTLFKYHWTILINSINILGYLCFNHNTFDTIKHDVLYRLIIQPKISKMDALSMIRVIRDFVFFRPEKSDCSILNSKLSQDPFNQTVSNSKSSFAENENNNVDDEEEAISTSNSDNAVLKCLISNSLPNQNDFGYQKIKLQTLTNSFHVRFDLNAVGPVLRTKNSADSAFSDDGSFNFEFTNNENYECDIKIIEVITNLKEVIENVLKTEIVDSSMIFKYKFGMRFSDIDEKWLDLDLVKSTFLLYKSYKDIQYIETMKIMAHFVSKYDLNFVNRMKIYFMNLNTYLVDLNKISLYEQMEMELTSHDDMINHQNLLFSDAYVNFYNICLNDISLINKNNEHIEIFDSVTKFESQLEKVDLNNKYIWCRLWHSLTITRAPWSESIFDDKEEGFQRMNKFCYAYCRSKIKRIKYFDKHVKASLMRDVSDEKKVDNILSTIYKKSSPKSPLFVDIGNEYKNKNSDTSIILKSDNKDTLDCKLITIQSEKNALIKFDVKSIIITIINENKTFVIPYDNIYSILYAYQHQKYSGIQICTKNRKDYLVIFPNYLFRTLILRIRYMPAINISKVQNENPKSFLNSLKLTDHWIDGKITNFEYLISLNILSGRSFNDSTQYPIFPWILTDYESDTLDLNSPSVFRDLSKPMGALNEKRLNELFERWSKIKEKESNSYLYENCYSNLSIVCYYLIRLEPFTTQHIQANNGRFDDSSLIFKSIKETFLNATSASNDFRELIPEFFYYPEFLRNINKLDLGKTGENDVVNDVVLPKWSNNSPFQFIYLHRKALESDFVSSHLNEWIDLIWGYKQEGEEAVNANNVFRPEIYESIWKRADANEKGIKAVQSNVGQIPLKLFDSKHPVKKAKLNSYVHKSSISAFCKPFKNSMFSFENDFNIHHSLINFFEVSVTSSVYASLLPTKNKFNVTLLNDKGCIFQYSVDFKLIKSTSFALRAKSSSKIMNDKKNKNSENSEHSIFFPRFIDAKRLCFYDKESKSIKIVKCKKGTINESIKQNFDVVSIETNSEGLIAISANDATVTVYDINKPRPSSTSPSVNTMTCELKSRYDDFDDSSHFGAISSFSETVNCIAISPTFDALICGTKDNCLLFCQLDLNKMKINKLVKMKGKPQKIVITDILGFVAVLATKIINGGLIQKLVLYSINGEKVNSLNFMKKKIVAVTKAVSSPGGFDFLVIADDENNIYVFEAFYLKLGDPVFKCNSNIIKLTYIKEESVIFAFCEDGTAAIIYYPIIN